MADEGASAPKRPSRFAVVLAFAVALMATVVLVVLGLFVRDGAESGAPRERARIDFTGIPQDADVLGSPIAPVTLIEYADLQCPSCRQYALEILPGLVADYVRSGQVRAEFRGYPFLGDDSVKAQRFVLAAGLQDRLWNLQDALYRAQEDENSGWVTDELIRELAGGIAGLDVARLFRDAAADETAQSVAAGVAESKAAGVPGTPTFFIRVGSAEPYELESGVNEAQIRTALDDALGR